jgi:hypothetical protein
MYSHSNAGLDWFGRYALVRVIELGLSLKRSRPLQKSLPASFATARSARESANSYECPSPGRPAPQGHDRMRPASSVRVTASPAPARAKNRQHRDDFAARRAVVTLS